MGLFAEIHWSGCGHVVLMTVYGYRIKLVCCMWADHISRPSLVRLCYHCFAAVVHCRVAV